MKAIVNFNMIHQINPFPQKQQQQLNSLHKPMIMNTQVMNHQQHYLIATTTSIKHEFYHKSTTT